MVQRVKILATHRDPDIDDVEGIRLLMNYGEERFPGASTAKVLMSSSRTPFQESLQNLEKDGILCVGIAGSIFDEHPVGAKEAKSADCATTLVAKHLGIDSKPELQKNVGYALKKNYSALTDHWEIAPLVKLAFRHGPKTSAWTARVFKASFLFLNVAEQNEKAILSGESPKGEATLSMDAIIAEWLLRKYKGYTSWWKKLPGIAKERGQSLTTTASQFLGKSGDETLRFILKYAADHQTPDCASETDFRLAELVCLAQKHLCVGNKKTLVRNQIKRATLLFVEAMWRKDYDFHVLCEKDWSSSTTHHAFVRRGKEELRITSVVSDNSEIPKYCRSRWGGGASIVIKQDSNGNVQVFFDKKAGIDPRRYVALIRLAERVKNGKPGRGYTFEELMQIGSNIEGAEVWYFDGHQLLNGSLTTDVEPTKLSRDEIESIVLDELERSTRYTRR